MLSDDIGVGVDIVMRSVTLTSLFCSDSGWVIGGEVAATQPEFTIFNCEHDYDDLMTILTFCYIAVIECYVI